jgi:hypothetical protein
MGACYSESYIKYDIPESSSSAKNSELSFESSSNSIMNKKVSLQDFECLKVLGKIKLKCEVAVLKVFFSVIVYYNK